MKQLLLAGISLGMLMSFLFILASSSLKDAKLKKEIKEIKKETLIMKIRRDSLEKIIESEDNYDPTIY